MVRVRGSKWLVVALGLLTAGCAGAAAVAAGLAIVGAGAIAATCYDQVAITVVDRESGAKLCDAKVTFTEGSSVTTASSCYAASLSKGKYKMKVTRPPMVPFEMPMEVTGGCQHAVQTIYVAMDRPETHPAPQRIAPRGTVAAPVTAPSAPASVVTPTPSAVSGVPSAVAPTPSTVAPTPSALAPVPSAAPSSSAVPLPSAAPVPSAAPSNAAPPPSAAPSGGAPPAAGSFPVER